METNLILGGPGCGKTTRLLDIVEEEMLNVPPNRIAFVAYTTAAANEAKERAAKKFSINPKKDLPWFRTIHSLAYRQLGISRDEVMGWRDWKTFSAIVGVPMTTFREEDGGAMKQGDQMLQCYDLARCTRTPLKEQWDGAELDISWFEFERFFRALEKFKEDNGKIDFTDMLLDYVRMGQPVNIDVAIIDEAQDLTPLQWEVIDKAFDGAARRYIGGDDDQAIYEWAGADINRFQSLSTTPEVLPVSHRMAESIFQFSQELVTRISHRYEKPFRSKREGGTVQWHMRPTQVDLSEGSWLLLARNGYMLRELELMVRYEGYVYRNRKGLSVKPGHATAIFGWEAWREGESLDAATVRAILKVHTSSPQFKLNDAVRYEPQDLPLDVSQPWHEVLDGISMPDRFYYRACNRRGDSLQSEPRIRIDTIHGVKGAEADHVLLMTDMSARTHRQFIIDGDGEHRVFYVGSTRARESLHLISPQSPLFYPV